ncbi:MAG: M48 family metalloprotease, partial [Muribaculaceae bacterium]|nr:M48 family metalloprotease [Muribaculaceae bacterium]
IGALGEALAGASYSKKQENEADAYGYEFLRTTGKNPRAMAKSFKKLKELQGDAKNSKINQLFSSHPDLDARIKKMEERADKDGYSL